MSDNLLDIDLAMNLIKEEMIKELSESVVKQNNDTLYKDIQTNGFSFSENMKD